MVMLWFNFILDSIFVFLCFILIIIHYHTQNAKEIKNWNTTVLLHFLLFEPPEIRGVLLTSILISCFFFVFCFFCFFHFLLEKTIGQVSLFEQYFCLALEIKFCRSNVMPGCCTFNFWHYISLKLINKPNLINKCNGSHNTTLQYGQYLMYEHDHITQAVAASCFSLVGPHQHGIPLGHYWRTQVFVLWVTQWDNCVILMILSIGCDITAKAEHLNPGGSVKDRAALYLLKEAEEKGNFGCKYPSNRKSSWIYSGIPFS